MGFSTPLPYDSVAFVMQPGRLTFREVCVSGVDTEESRSLNDLSDDLLARIFAFVVGPLKRQEHYINNGILLRHEHMQPTMVSNFDDLVVLNLVCKRWHDIVQQRYIKGQKRDDPTSRVTVT